MVTTTLFHRTTDESAAAILASGFRDARGRYGFDVELEGVWLSDRPLDCNEGTTGDVLLTVTFVCSFADLDYYEVVEEARSFREWCIPASFINEHAVVEVTDETEFVEPNEGNL